MLKAIASGAGRVDMLTPLRELSARRGDVVLERAGPFRMTPPAAPLPLERPRGLRHAGAAGPDLEAPRRPAAAPGAHSRPGASEPRRAASYRPASSSRAMIVRWISEVPAPISISFASRAMRSTGKSRV